MSKPKKKKSKKEPQTDSPEMAYARKQHEELPARMLQCQADGVTEFEFFDGSVFQLHEDVWTINTSHSFYFDRYLAKEDAKETMTKAWDAVSEARVVIEGRSPYFVRAALSLGYFPSWGTQAWLNAQSLDGFITGKTDHSPQTYPVGDHRGCRDAFVTSTGVMGFDPHVFANMEPELIAAVIVHEALHIHRDHHGDIITGNPMTDNILHDLEINDDIVEMGYTLENGWLPKAIGAPDFLHAVEYLAYLPPPQESQDGGGKSDGESGEGEKGEGQEGAGKTRKPKFCSSTPQNPSCGSGSGGERLDAEDKIPGELNKDEAQLEAARQDTAGEILKHAAGEEGRGNVPAGLLRWAEGRMKPATIPWKRMLRPAVRNLCSRRRGYSYVDSKLSKSTISALALSDDLSSTVLRYASYQPRAKLLIALDTSGSMDEIILASALGEIQGALKADIADVYFISFDCETYEAPIKVETSIQEFRGKVRGGGGTNVMAVYNDPRVQKGKYDCIAIVTDGDTGVANRCPIKGVENLFVIINGPNPFRSAGVTWGKTKVLHVNG